MDSPPAFFGAQNIGFVSQKRAVSPLVGRLSKAHAWSATVLVDELHPDTGGLTLLVLFASSGGALRLDALCNLRLQFPPRQLQIIVGLQIQPELRAVTEVQPKAESRSAVMRRRLFTISVIRFG